MKEKTLCSRCGAPMVPPFGRDQKKARLLEAQLGAIERGERELYADSGIKKRSNTTLGRKPPADLEWETLPYRFGETDLDETLKVAFNR